MTLALRECWRKPLLPETMQTTLLYAALVHNSFSYPRCCILLTLARSDDWMAPEVILGMDYDEKSDVFSYGILLLEMILGTKTIKNELKRAPMNAFELNFGMDERRN